MTWVIYLGTLGVMKMTQTAFVDLLADRFDIQ